ncbi:hypothetical protein [Candidatus Leptofilum sp.]|uniref:hypothetical protein n=1 Tax=Candidatus Leptofilum sp. TaxID=3241576 RepID=UPI003B59645D
MLYDSQTAVPHPTPYIQQNTLHSPKFSYHLLTYPHYFWEGLDGKQRGGETAVQLQKNSHCGLWLLRHQHHLAYF